MKLERLVRSKWVVLSQVFACGLALSGCIAAVPDEDDPASLIGDDDLWDEGPPPGEEPTGEATGTTSEGVSGMPPFQLPFPCGQVWAGQTRTNHSPVNSVDFNRSDDLGDTVVAAASGTVTRVENLGSTS